MRALPIFALGLVGCWTPQYIRQPTTPDIEVIPNGPDERAPRHVEDVDDTPPPAAQPVAGTADDDADSIKTTVRKYTGQMKYCYESRLRTNPNLTGRVEVAWVLDGGRPTRARVVSDGVGDNELTKCMLDKLERWEFEGQLAGEVRWPFVFRPS